MTKQENGSMDDVEHDLLFDLTNYGHSFHKIVDGKKVRIHPMYVYIRRPWYKRLWDPVYWWWWNLWLKR